MLEMKSELRNAIPNTTDIIDSLRNTMKRNSNGAVLTLCGPLGDIIDLNIIRDRLDTNHNQRYAVKTHSPD